MVGIVLQKLTKLDSNLNGQAIAHSITSSFDSKFVLPQNISSINNGPSDILFTKKSFIPSGKLKLCFSLFSDTSVSYSQFIVIPLNKYAFDSAISFRILGSKITSFPNISLSGINSI